MQEKKAITPQLCWDCTHAVPSADGTRGCPWSIRAKPVPGWTAERVKFNAGHDYTYKIIGCPMFLRDGTPLPSSSHIIFHMLQPDRQAQAMPS